MGWSEHHKIVLVCNAPQGCGRGYTLFCNSFGGNYAYLIDIDGRICHQWHSSEGMDFSCPTATCFCVPTLPKKARVPEAQRRYWNWTGIAMWCGSIEVP